MSQSGIAMASRATCSAKPLPTAWSVAAMDTATKSPAISRCRSFSSRTLGRRAVTGAPEASRTRSGTTNGDGIAMSVSTATSGATVLAEVLGVALTGRSSNQRPRHSGFLQRPRGRFGPGALGDADGRLRRENPEAATLVRIEDQRGDLGPGMRVELRERRGQVRLDRGLGEVQLVGDVPVREPAPAEPQHLLLAVRQRLADDVLAQRARHDDLPGMHGAHRQGEAGLGLTVEHDGVGAG